MEPLSRRRFLQRGLVLAGLSLPLGCGLPPLLSKPAAVGARARMIGYLCPGCPPGGPPPASPLYWPWLNGLRALGYVDGQNIAIEYRGTDQPEALPDLAAELVASQVEVLVTGGGSQAAQAARQATDTIPIVFIAVGDPVGAGLVASIPRPGGNTTGLSNFSPEVAGKRLELLQAAVPAVRRVDVIWDSLNPGHAPEWASMQTAADLLNLTLRVHDVQDLGALQQAFAAIGAQPPDALYLAGDPFIMAGRRRALELVASTGLPSMHPSRELVEAGGLLSYGVNLADLALRAAGHVDKILRGTSPAALPVEAPTKFDFVINRKTEQTLRLAIPESVLRQASEIIR